MLSKFKFWGSNLLSALGIPIRNEYFLYIFLLRRRDIMLRALLGSCLLCCGGGTPAGGVLIGTPPPGEGVSAGSVAAAAFKNGANLAQNITAGVRCGGFSGFSVYLWFAMMTKILDNSWFRSENFLHLKKFHVRYGT
jgi:hypothetical protein